MHQGQTSITAHIAGRPLPRGGGGELWAQRLLWELRAKCSHGLSAPVIQLPLIVCCLGPDRQPLTGIVTSQGKLSGVVFCPTYSRDWTAGDRAETQSNVFPTFVTNAKSICLSPELDPGLPLLHAPFKGLRSRPKVLSARQPDIPV